jgi:hypothetical protein
MTIRRTLHDQCVASSEERLLHCNGMAERTGCKSEGEKAKTAGGDGINEENVNPDTLVHGPKLSASRMGR